MDRNVPLKKSQQRTFGESPTTDLDPQICLARDSTNFRKANCFIVLGHKTENE
jgi:hypothetical protein